MSNNKIPSFERNNYYYGKLLTVRDFQLEQQYGIAKRELMNRYVIGSGIVDGLLIDQVGGRGIRITQGLAIDGEGTEIVVTREYVQSDIKELSGYPLEGEGDKTVYVALAYQEHTREPIPTMANSSCCQEVCEANRIMESFKVELTTTPPQEGRDFCNLLNESTVLFKNTKISVERIVPRFVTPGDSFKVVLRLTALQPLTESDNIRVVIYDEVSETLYRLQETAVAIIPEAAQAGTIWEKSYTLRAGNQKVSTVIGGSLYVQEQETGNTYDSPGSILDIVDHQTLLNKLTELAFNSQDDAQEDPVDPRVIIGTLTLDSQGIITKVSREDRRYVYNNTLLSEMLSCTHSQVSKLAPHAVSHQAGGDDPINVENLQGVLADPQRVRVYYNGDAFVEVKSISFSGEGVNVTSQGENVAFINIEGGGSGGGGKHAQSHQAGGEDPINVAGLPGVLEEAQRVAVSGNRSEGTPFYKVAGTLCFVGDGVSLNEDGDTTFIHIYKDNSTNYEVLTGVVKYNNVPAGIGFISDSISVDIRNKAVTFWIEADGKIFTPTDGSAYQASVSIAAEQSSLQIISAHNVTGTNRSWKVRYFVMSATRDLGEVGSRSILS